MVSGFDRDFLLAVYENEEDFNLFQSFCKKESIIIPYITTHLNKLKFKKTIINHDIPPISSHVFIRTSKNSSGNNWDVLKRYTEEERDIIKREIRRMLGGPFGCTTKMWFNISIGDKNDRHSKWWKSVLILTNLETGYRYYLSKDAFDKLIKIEPRLTLSEDTARLCQLYPQEK
jgi:hypothetical protein